MNLFATPLGRSQLERAFSEAELEFMQNEPIRAVANHSPKNNNVLGSEAMSGTRDVFKAYLSTLFSGELGGKSSLTP